MPQQRARPAYLDVPFVALAHRGGFSDRAPIACENTLRAFQAAWDLGYRYLETDVHVTRDGVLVAFHDVELDRVTDTVGRIAELTWEEVSRARIGAVGEYSGERVPKFSELLDAFPEARFNIDIKAPSGEWLLAELLAERGAAARVCIGSFSGSRLRRFRGLSRGRVATSMPPLQVALFCLLPFLRKVMPLTGQAFQIPERDERTGLRLVSRRMIAAAHRRGMAVHVWTVNDRSDMERLIELGVDGLITDDIAMLKDVLIARNLWEEHA